LTNYYTVTHDIDIIKLTVRSFALLNQLQWLFFECRIKFKIASVSPTEYYLLPCLLSSIHCSWNTTFHIVDCIHQRAQNNLAGVVGCKATPPLTSLAADQTAHRVQDSAHHLQGAEDFEAAVPRRPAGDPSHFTCCTFFWCATPRLVANTDWTCEASFRSRSSRCLEFTASCSLSLSNCFDL